MNVIEKVLEKYVSSDEADVIQITDPPLNLRDQAAVLKALPVFLDMGGCYALRPDSTIVSFSWDEPDEISIEEDQRIINMALCQGAKRYPELTDLLPKRPDDAQTCEFCDGSGLANDLPEHLRESIVCFCGGLGWIASAAGPLNARVVSDSYRTEKVKSFRLFAVGILIVVAGVLVWANWPADSLDEHVEADRVVISKSDQSLALLRNGQVLRMYPVSLGANPVGHKQREGDERTPEGIYVVDYRKPDSSFHRALHISYPNAEDIDRAARSGVDPGGLIMIHGLPNRAPFLGRLHRLVNWTDGCIAVTNKEMDQIWAAVDDGTAVEIRP